MKQQPSASGDRKKSSGCRAVGDHCSFCACGDALIIGVGGNRLGGYLLLEPQGCDERRSLMEWGAQQSQQPTARSASER